MAKRFTYDDIRNLDASEVGKMSEADIKNLLAQARKKYDVRSRLLKRVREKTYSPAMDKMESYYTDLGRQPIEDISRNRAYNELFNIQQFFRSKTSDIKGAQEVARQQDIRLFGADSIGRAKHRMTVDQRTKFWNLYDDFTAMSPSAESIYGYQNMWTELAAIIVEQPNLLDDKMAVFDTLKARLRSSQDEKEKGFDRGATTFSGTWDNFD